MPVFTITDDLIDVDTSSGTVAIVSLDLTDIAEDIGLSSEDADTDDPLAVTIVGEQGLDDIDVITITGIGNENGAQDVDVITFDLSTFNDSFSIVVTKGSDDRPSSDDCIVFAGADTLVDLGNGNWLVTYTNGGTSYTLQVFAGDAQVKLICFARGTLIATRQGSVPIEDLKTGDEVITMDRGFQPIRWIGSNSVKASGHLAPVVIRKGVMGNDRDLRVSPQHRMLVRGWHVELMFGQREALVPAKALVNDETVFQLEGGTVEYFHMMFDRHELVYAEGIPSESFHPGHVGMGSFAEETRNEIFELFPSLRGDLANYSEQVRPSLKVREAQVLAENPELMKD